MKFVVFVLAMVLSIASTSSQATPFAMTQDNCSWDQPGADRYTGNVSDAVDYYIDIPKASRVVLKNRIEKHQYDDLVDITRDSIQGKLKYTTDIKEMHFGANKVCSTVTRTRWSTVAIQKALVYCEDKHCIIVPFICGNISRLKKLDHPEISEKYRFEEPRVFNPKIEQPTPVPEPGTIFLMIFGLAAIFVSRSKKSIL